jgi:hypothetical protein
MTVTTPRTGVIGPFGSALVRVSLRAHTIRAMWLGGVDIPEGLVDARRDGKLVIFAGAGISVPRPSSIPTFREIVATIEAESGHSRRRAEPPDVFLGRVENLGYPVHERVERVILSGGSENAIHRAIVDLFGSPGELRVVTTNFDRLLSAAANARLPGEAREYIAPALPLGDDMTGIVYLHGAAGGGPSALVLTDADFGSAYLTRGYARRFLVQLFSSNVVLFIGYSHRDTVLNYLARGLPPSTEPRFALVQSGEVDRWRALSVEPVVYSTVRGRPRHVAMLAPLAEWGRYLRMGFGDHRREVREIVRRGPGGDRQSEDYLRARIRDPDTVTFFCEEAANLAWLEWISREPFFQSMLSGAPTGSAGEVDAALAWWFADKYASTHPVEAMATVARLGGKLSAPAWHAVARRLWVQRPPPEHLSAWLPILFGSVPDQTGDLLDYLLRSSRPDEDDHAAILLFDFLTDPQPVVESLAAVFTEDGRETARTEVKVRGDAHWLSENYENVFRGRMDAFAPPLLALVTHHLRTAHAIYRAGGSANDDWDPTSIRRSAIEPHEQNAVGLSDWLDVLVDAARDAIEWACEHEPVLARSYIDQWVASPVPLLRRLAVHGVGAAAWMDADSRLNWLVEGRLVLSTPARHEVYTLLATAYPLASREARDVVLSSVDQGPVEPRIAAKPDLAARVTFDLLQWLSEVAPDDPEVRSRLERAGEGHPEFIPRPHPDLLSWMEAGAPEPPSPVEAKELGARNPKDSETLDWLLSYELDAAGHEFDIRSPRRPLLQSVSSASSKDPEWGLELAETLEARGEFGTDLWEALAESWTKASLTEAQWTRVLDLLLRHGNKKDHARPFVAILEEAVRSSPPLIPIALIPAAESVGRGIWEELVDAPPGRSVAGIDDWLERAINEPAGQLVTFFLHAMSLARVADPAEGLYEERRRLFESMLFGDSYANGLARAVLASQAHFLHSVDREWTLGTLFPVMDWAVDPAKARQAWDGFLSWGRLNPTLVDDLLPMYESAFRHLARFGRLRERFAEHLSVVAFLSSVGPVSEGWLLRFVQRADPANVVTWTQFVTHQLRNMQDAGREVAWRDWISPYWRHRIQGNPRPLTPEEAKDMAEWPLYLPTVFEDAVARVCDGPTGGADGLLFYSLEKTDLPERYPEVVTRLVRHVLIGQQRPFWHCVNAVAVGHRVAAAPSVAAADLKALVDELLRLHCPGAEGIQRIRESGPE